jgi:hypothetical protein
MEQLFWIVATLCFLALMIYLETKGMARLPTFTGDMPKRW